MRMSKGERSPLTDGVLRNTSAAQASRLSSPATAAASAAACLLAFATAAATLRWMSGACLLCSMVHPYA